MPTCCEVLPATKSSPHNGLDYTPGTGSLVVKTSRVYVTYAVSEFPTDWDGRAFRLTKAGGEAYSVFCSARGPAGDACDCPGHAYGRGKPCKHLAALRALLANDWL